MNVEKDKDSCEEKLRTFITESADFYSSIEHPTSPKNPPNKKRRRIFHMAHLFPDKLRGDCSVSEFNKFRRDFKVYMKHSYPDGYELMDFQAVFFNRIDAKWHSTLFMVGGLNDSASELEIWEECESWMLTKDPLYCRRMRFLNLTQERNETPSHYLLRLKEEASNAKIAEMTQSAWVLTIFCRNLPFDDPVRALAFEELIKNPNTGSLSLQ